MPNGPREDLVAVAEERLAEIRAGAPGAWEELIEQYGPLVLSIPRELGISPEESEEVFQDTWAALHRQVEAIRRPGSLVHWISVTARRIALRRLLAEKDEQAERQRREDPAEPAPSVLDHCASLELRQAVHEGLAEISERCRELLRSLYFDRSEPTYAEAGARLGIGRAAASALRTRCLTALARVLQRRGLP